MKRILWWAFIGTLAVSFGGPSASRAVVIIGLAFLARWSIRKLWRLTGRLTGVDTE